MSDDPSPIVSHLPVTPEQWHEMAALRDWMNARQGDTFKITEAHLMGDNLFQQLNTLTLTLVQVNDLQAATTLAQHLFAYGYVMGQTDAAMSVDATERDLPEGAGPVLEAIEKAQEDAMAAAREQGLEEPDE